MQTSFQIEIKGKKICKYKADFQYFDRTATGPDGQTGALVVEDVKGMRTAIYRLKKKLVEVLMEKHQILRVKEDLEQERNKYFNEILNQQKIIDN